MRVPVCVVLVGARGVCCACACDRASSVVCVLVRPHSQAKVRRVHVRGFGRIREPKCRAGAGMVLVAAWVGGVGWRVIRWVLCFRVRCFRVQCHAMLCHVTHNTLGWALP